MPSFSSSYSFSFSSDLDSEAITLDASGGLQLSSDIYNPTGVQVTFNNVLDSSWTINANVSRTFSSEWNIGTPVLYYYQVHGKCLAPPTCANSGTGSSDPTCAASGSYFIQIIAAYNLADLCT